MIYTFKNNISNVINKQNKIMITFTYIRYKLKKIKIGDGYLGKLNLTTPHIVKFIHS